MTNIQPPSRLVRTRGGEVVYVPTLQEEVWDEVLRLAPILKLHSSEVFFPMDPMDFVRVSRFRRHIANGTDYGFSKVTFAWVKDGFRGNHKARHYYDIPVEAINSYGLHESGPDKGKHRRPRGDGVGSSFQVFLQPRSRPYGVYSPTGSVPVFAYPKTDSCATSKGADYLIQYWWFFGFNPGPQGHTNYFGHQGDWEHVSIAVKNGSVVGAYFGQHKPTPWYDRAALRFQSDRLQVFVARGSHASYPSRGKHKYVAKSVQGQDVPFWDVTDESGVQWDTTSTVVPLSSQSWKDFAGAWGEVGLRSETTGPLGPWHVKGRKC